MPQAKFDVLLRSACAMVVALFGCWTLLANAVVLSGNSFADLSRWTFLALVAAAVVLAYLHVDHTFGPSAPATTDTASAESPKSEKTLVQLLIGAGLAAIFAFGRQYLIFWILTVLYLGVTYCRETVWREPVWRERQAPGLPFREVGGQGWNYLALAVAAVVAVLAAFWLNLPSADQSLYVNMAVSVLDAPNAPIYATDTLHGVPGAYLLPTYRVHSFELLAAWVAQAFHIPEPIWVFHFLLGPFFALFSVCTAAVCLRRLLPQRWGWAVLTLTGLLLILCGAFRMYGNFAYVMIYQGKSVFVTAMIPLIVTYALDFFARPRLGHWLLLLLAQVCAVGFTANALYAAPLAAGFALAACWRPTWSDTRRLGLGLLASIYPVLLGLIIRSAVIREGLESLDSFQGGLFPIEAAVHEVLGQGATLWLWLLGLTCAWCLVRDRAIRHWVLGFSLGFTLICLNPFLDDYWGKYVTAQFLTWRLLWVIPLPVFLSLLITQGIASSFERAPGQKLVFGFMVLALLLPFTFDQSWNDPLLRPEVRLGLKVPQPQYAVAKQLSEVAGTGRPVLAPENVAEWVPTFRQHAYPLVARGLYTQALLTAYSRRVNLQDIHERLALAAYVNETTNSPSDAEALLRSWLAANKISAIAVPQSFKWITEITRILNEAGWESSVYLDYLIFVKR